MKDEPQPDVGAGRDRCVGVLRKVLDWETMSKFSEDPSRIDKFEPVSGEGAPISLLRQFDDVVVSCGDGLLAAQVVSLGQKTILLCYYSEYVDNGQKRFRIIRQNQPYKVDFSDFIKVLMRTVSRERVHPRLWDVNVVFEDFPRCGEESFISDRKKATKKLF